MITFYKTYSWGGMEGRTWESKLFETEELAREYAANDSWNTGYELAKITIDGMEVKEEQLTM